MKNLCDAAVRTTPYGGGSCSEGNPAETIRLTIPGLTRYVAIARNAVDAVTEQIHLSADDRMAVRLAVGEACNNAVFHAPHHCDSVARVIVACRVCSDLLEIDVANDGGMQHLPPKHTMMPDTSAEHGRGMALIELLMDSVEYIVHDGRTVVRMRKRLPAIPN